jgi:hypothetical protein
MSQPVPRLGRALDLLGLLLFAAGAGCYGYAYVGLEGIRTGDSVIAGGMFATLNEAKALTTVSEIGIAVAIAGIGVFIAAFMVARAARLRGPSSA